MVVYLEQGADLLMPLPLTVSCFSKIQIGFTFLVPAHLGCPRSKAVKRSLLLLLYIYKILLLLASTTTLVSRYQKVKPVWIN